MAKVHKELQHALSKAATCIANDDLTGARDEFAVAINYIDVTVGTLSPISTGRGAAAAGDGTKTGGKKNRRKKGPSTVRRRHAGGSAKRS